jgi:hypothetical protein
MLETPKGRPQVPGGFFDDWNTEMPDSLNARNRIVAVIIRDMTSDSSGVAIYNQRKWALFGLILLSHIYFLQIYPNFIPTNELSRLLLLSAVVDDHTFQIDRAIARYSDSEDKAKFNGHYYSDKSIGVSFLALPFFLLMRAIEAAASLRFSAAEAITFLRIFTITIPSILFLPMIARFWRKLRPDRELVPEFLFLLLFGTIAFTYSIQLISHYLMGLLLFAAVYLLRICKEEGNQTQRLLLAGTATGLALMMEYPAVFAVAMVCIYSLYAVRRPGSIVLFSLPIAVSLVMMLAYNDAIFGTPFDVTYRHMVARHTAQHVQGIVGVAFPTAEAFYGLLLSRHHGLFFTSPFLLFGVPGLLLFWRDRKWRIEAALFLGIIFSFVFIYSGFSYWIGGWAFGPRYFAPIIPFMVTATYYFFTEPKIRQYAASRVLLIVSGVISILLITAGTITFPYPPDPLRDPNFFVAFPLMFHGGYGRNLGTWIGLHHLGPALLFYILLLSIFLVAMLPPGSIQAPGGKAIRRWLVCFLLVIAFTFAGFVTSPVPDAKEYYARGLVYYFLAKYDLSATDLEQALKTNPGPELKARTERALIQLQTILKREKGGAQ